jgi:hypothetical protein
MEGLVLQILAPAIGALITSLIRAGLPRIPTILLPFIATAAGAVTAYLGGAGAELAGALGGFSVALREMVDQTKKKLNTGARDTLRLASLTLFVGIVTYACTRAVTPMPAPTPTPPISGPVEPGTDLLQVVVNSIALGGARYACIQIPAAQRDSAGGYVELLDRAWHRDPLNVWDILVTSNSAGAWISSVLIDAMAYVKTTSPNEWMTYSIAAIPSAIAGCRAGLGIGGAA